MFSYPNTAMTGWLCRSIQNLSSSCPDPNDYMYCPNNSSSMGGIFYNQITSVNAPPHYNVYAVDSCNGPEGVPPGNVAAIIVNGQPQNGGMMVEQDMAGGSVLTKQCFHGAHTK